MPVVLERGMGLLLREKREAVLQRWVELTFQTYPAETAAFLGRQQDRFRNPVGYATRESLRVLLEALLEGNTAEGGCATQAAAEVTRKALDDIIRIRAVQNFSPADAAGFPLLLKQAVREVAECPDTAEVLEFFEKIDRLALVAFEVYSQCREQLYQVRVKELVNRQATPRSLRGRENDGGCASEASCDPAACGLCASIKNDLL